MISHVKDGRQKISTDLVLQIIESDETARICAERLGISKSTVTYHRIKNRYAKKHIGGAAVKPKPKLKMIDTKDPYDRFLYR